jgi:hypothetical protein
VVAINFLRGINVDVEIGFILFDPLCTINEVRENIDFLQSNHLAEVTSSLGSGLELRLHLDAPYVAILGEYEANTGISLFKKEYNNDFLNYSSSYVNESVKILSEFVKEANSTIRPLYYPLKSLSRYGENGSLGPHVTFIKKLVIDIRNIYIQKIESFSLHVEKNLGKSDDLNELILSIVTLFNENEAELRYIADGTGNDVLADMLKKYSSIAREVTV